MLFALLAVAQQALGSVARERCVALSSGGSQPVAKRQSVGEVHSLFEGVGMDEEGGAMQVATWTQLLAVSEPADDRGSASRKGAAAEVSALEVEQAAAGLLPAQTLYYP